MTRATLIVNPRTRRGRALRLAPQVSNLLRGAGFDTEIRVSERPGGAVQLAAAAVAEGADAVVTLGGDGTIGEVVNGVLAAGAGTWPDGLTLAPLPLGTGNSFVRHFGPRSGDWRGALSGLLQGQWRRIDAARAVWEEGEVERRRYFVNVFGTGFIARVADTTNRRLKALGGQGYTVGVLWELARLTAPRTLLAVDGVRGDEADGPLTLVSVCNTQWTGENMWVAPSADPEDGLLDVITLGPVSRLELVRLFPHIFSGTHLTHPAVRAYRGARVRIEPDDESPLLIDGEVAGCTPVEVEVVPRAIQLAL